MLYLLCFDCSSNIVRSNLCMRALSLMTEKKNNIPTMGACISQSAAAVSFKWLCSFASWAVTSVSFLHRCCYIVERPFSLGSCFIIITAAEQRRSGIQLEEFHFLFWPEVSAKKCSLGNDWISAKLVFQMQGCVAITCCTRFVCMFGWV